MKDQSGKPKVKYFGIVFSEYTPAVEGQLLRDCLQLMDVARHKVNELVMVCPDPAPERMLNALGLTLLSHHEGVRDWVMYRTEKDWPIEPDNARTIVQRDLFMSLKDKNMMVLDDRQSGGYYLPPQGRLSPDTLSLLRPAPNGYIPTDPALLMLWS